MDFLRRVWQIEMKDVEFDYYAKKYTYRLCCSSYKIHIKVSALKLGRSLQHVTGIILPINFVLIFVHIALLFKGTNDLWKIMYIPMEVLAFVTLFTGLITQQKNALLPVLFLQGLKVFAIGSNLYNGICDLTDWDSPLIGEVRHSLDSENSDKANDRTYVKFLLGKRLALDYGTAIISYLVFFYIVLKCRRYFAELGHVTGAAGDDDELETETPPQPKKSTV